MNCRTYRHILVPACQSSFTEITEQNIEGTAHDTGIDYAKLCIKLCIKF